MRDHLTQEDAMGEAAPSQDVATVERAVTPMQMLQIAVEQGADLDKLTKLMDLQERWQANEARKAFVEAMSAFKANPPDLIKNKRVSFGQGNGKTAYNHATLDRVSEAIGTALADHGLSHRWDVQQDDGTIRVTCILTHALGHSERVTMSAGADTSGSKNSIQAIGSAVTYLQRYTLLAATGVAARDQDNDGASAVDPIDERQKQHIIDLIKETGTNTQKLLQAYRVSSVDELPAAKFGDVVMRLNERGREKARLRAERAKQESTDA